jgi:hypothetical protein
VARSPVTWPAFSRGERLGRLTAAEQAALKGTLEKLI